MTRRRAWPQRSRSPRQYRLAGSPLVGTLSAAIIIVVVSIAYRYGFDVDGIRLVIRTTARTSLLLFSLAFTASAVYRLWPNAWTGWQRNNRRYLGVSFAVSHAVHAIAILIFASLDPEQFRQMVSAGTFVLGGVAYLFIIAMTLTSFDRTAAWIGPLRWRILHTCGAYMYG
jgi:methionine sulfoxide reductase heme-binding subunit